MVSEGTRGRDLEALLDAGALAAAGEPGGDVGELGGEVDAEPGGAVGPAEDGDVGDAEAALGAGAGDVPARAREPRVQDPVQALGLADVALRAVRAALVAREQREVVRLPLHGAQAAVLPADPRLGLGPLVAVDGEAEPVVPIIGPGQVAEDGGALEHVQALTIAPGTRVVHDGGDAPVRVDCREPWLLLRVLMSQG